MPLPKNRRQIPSRCHRRLSLEVQLFCSVFFLSSLLPSYHQGPLADSSTFRLGVAHDTDDLPRIRDLLALTHEKPDDCIVEPLSGPGFRNSLYKIHCGDHGSNKLLVVKLFSTLAKRRRNPDDPYHVDRLASDHNLGPKLFACTDDGILMECLSFDSMGWWGLLSHQNITQKKILLRDKSNLFQL